MLFHSKLCILSFKLSHLLTILLSHQATFYMGPSNAVKPLGSVTDGWLLPSWLHIHLFIMYWQRVMSVDRAKLKSVKKKVISKFHQCNFEYLPSSTVNKIPLPYRACRSSRPRQNYERNITEWSNSFTLLSLPTPLCKLKQAMKTCF
jgi:hypothetical protein